MSQVVAVSGALDPAVLSGLPPLRDAYLRGRQRWPTLAADEASFVRYLGERAGDEGAHELHVEDLYLAWGCARGDASALLAFDETMRAPIRVALARVDAPDQVKQDALGAVRERLFVKSPARAPRICEYGGRGPLRRWLQAILVRACLDEVRRYRREVPLTDGMAEADLPMTTLDPELAYLKRVYRDAFGTALDMALADLGERERSLLRYHLVDGLSIDELGALHGLHRSTAFRWLERARLNLIRGVRDKLVALLGVPADEIDSILRVIRSQVCLGLERRLQ